jgi:hypothetical protein
MIKELHGSQTYAAKAIDKAYLQRSSLGKVKSFLILV